MTMSAQDNVSSARILVIDDEKVVATTLRAILEQQGYRTAVAFEGSNAVSLAQSFKPDVVVADIDLPNIDGIEAASQIVRESPHCHVLLYTGKPLGTSALAKAQAHGFTIVEKPIAPGDLISRVRETIRKQRSSLNAVVLIVDDHEVQRYAIGRMLQRAGFVVVEVGTGEEALAQARTGPDLILLDINLPDMSGFEVCKRLKASPATSHIPVVHLTATHRDDMAAATALSFGAEHLFTHPVHPEALLAKLRSIIEKTQK
jgi:CheY-like chemotaxis protein